MYETARIGKSTETETPLVVVKGWRVEVGRAVGGCGVSANDVGLPLGRCSTIVVMVTQL